MPSRLRPVPEIELCRLDQLADGRGMPVRADGRYLAVFLVDGEVHVIDNQCAHVGSPLDSGAVEQGRLVCPWHGWTYELATGHLVTAWGNRPGVRRYDASVRNGSVVVTLVD
jgi:nitrite reductase/ring-hydroxylating ferredoxin subunit